MAKRPITIELYGKMLAAFRESPGDHHYAAKKAGCYWRTAKKGWDEGWPAYPWGESIKTVIAKENAKARDKMASIKEAQHVSRQRVLDDASARAGALSVDDIADRDRARRDAVDASVEEGQLVRAARINALQLLTTLSDIGKHAAELAHRFAHEIESVEMKPAQIVKLFKDFAQAAKAANEMAEMSIKMERLVLGEPTEIMGVLPMDMSVDDAVREIIEANAALTRAQGMGVIDVTPKNGDRSLKALSAPVGTESPAEPA